MPHLYIINMNQRYLFPFYVYTFKVYVLTRLKF